jgi:hypothetical protein
MGLSFELDHAIKVRSYPGSPKGGDAGVFIEHEDGALVALIDASGHGLSAYSVAQKARSILNEHAHLEPQALLQLLDQGLKGTVGAAASIARIRQNTLTFAGIGNVSARIDTTRLVTNPGILGCRMRTPHVVKAAFPSGAWFLMHTDGVSSPPMIPPGSATSVAETLVDTLGTDTDDASVLALRWQQKV